MRQPIQLIFLILVGAACDPTPVSTHVNIRPDPPVNEPQSDTVKKFGQKLNIKLDCGSADCPTDGKFTTSIKALSQFYPQFTGVRLRISKITLDLGATTMQFNTEAENKQLTIPTPFDVAAVKAFFAQMQIIQVTESLIQPSGTTDNWVYINFGMEDFLSTATKNALIVLQNNATKITPSISSLKYIEFVDAPNTSSSCSGHKWYLDPVNVQKSDYMNSALNTLKAGCN